MNHRTPSPGYRHFETMEDYEAAQAGEPVPSDAMSADDVARFVGAAGVPDTVPISMPESVVDDADNDA